MEARYRLPRGPYRAVSDDRAWLESRGGDLSSLETAE